MSEPFDYEDYLDSLSIEERKDIQGRLAFWVILTQLVCVIMFAIGFGFILWLMGL